MKLCSPPPPRSIRCVPPGGNGPRGPPPPLVAYPLVTKAGKPLGELFSPISKGKFFPFPEHVRRFGVLIAGRNARIITRDLESIFEHVCCCRVVNLIQSEEG